MNIPHIRSGDYFIPDLKLPKETRPIGKWGRMHRDYLKEYHPVQFNALVLSSNLWTHIADLNEQAQQRMEALITQLKTVEGIAEKLKADDPIAWVQRMNSITARAEEIIREKLIYNGYIVRRLKIYIEAHPFDPGDSDYETVLEQLYHAYQESHESDPPDIREGFRELDDLLGDLPLEDNNTVFNLCCSLCTAYEHKAFLDGLQYGAHLMLELSEDCN